VLKWSGVELFSATSAVKDLKSSLTQSRKEVKTWNAFFYKDLFVIS